MTSFDFSKFDYSNGEQYMKELFNPSEFVDVSVAGFLNLPLTESYKNNAERTAEFSGITDTPDVKGPMDFNIEPVLTDASGNVLETVYVDMPVEEVNIVVSQPEETSISLDASDDGETDTESVSSR